MSYETDYFALLENDRLLKLTDSVIFKFLSENLKKKLDHLIINTLNAACTTSCACFCK